MAFSTLWASSKTGVTFSNKTTQLLEGVDNKSFGEVFLLIRPAAIFDNGEFSLLLDFKEVDFLADLEVAFLVALTAAEVEFSLFFNVALTGFKLIIGESSLIWDKDPFLAADLAALLAAATGSTGEFSLISAKSPFSAGLAGGGFLLAVLAGGGITELALRLLRLFTSGISGISAAGMMAERHRPIFFKAAEVGGDSMGGRMARRPLGGLAAAAAA